MIEEEAEVAALVVLEKCTKLNAQTVVQRQKYLSYPTLTDQYTAGNASKVIDHQKNIRIIQ